MAALPSTIAPMLLQPIWAPFDREGYAYELKWDGMRLITFTTDGGVRLQTRNLNFVQARFPEVAAQLASLPAGTVLDGELVVFRDGRPWFGGISRRLLTTTPSAVARLATALPATFIPFDCLFLEGECLYEQPLVERRRRLEGVASGILTLGEWFPSGTALFEAAVDAGLEGVVAKRLDAPYRPGARSGAWLKCKQPGYDRHRSGRGGGLKGTTASPGGG